MRFAFETVIWGRRIDDLDLVLDVMAAAGYEGVEFAQSPDEILIRDDTLPSGRRKLADIDELLGFLRAGHRNLANNRQPTRFEIALPFTLWHAPPKKDVRDDGVARWRG